MRPLPRPLLHLALRHRSQPQQTRRDEAAPQKHLPNHSHAPLRRPGSVLPRALHVQDFAALRVRAGLRVLERRDCVELHHVDGRFVGRVGGRREIGSGSRAEVTRRNFGVDYSMHNERCE